MRIRSVTMEIKTYTNVEGAGNGKTGRRVEK